MSRQGDARIYVGNLPPDIRQREIETLFDKYGKILKIDLKGGTRGPPFAFIEYEDHRDADDAIRGKNGTNFDGYSLRVEAPHCSKDGGRSRPSYGDRPPLRYDDRRSSYGDRYGDRGGRGGSDRGYDYDRGSGYGRSRDNGYDRDRRRTPERKYYKVVVTGFPDTTTISDLKKHMKDAGELLAADIRHGVGYVEYENNEDFRYAIKKLTGTMLEDEKGEKSEIAVREDKGSRSRSRSPVRKASASPNRQSASRSKSPTS